MQLPEKDRLFGTPMGAALLVSAIGAGSLTLNRALAYLVVTTARQAIDVWTILLFGMFCSLLYYTTLAAAAGICFRNLRRLLFALGFGMLISILETGGNYLRIFLVSERTFVSFPISLILQFAGTVGIGGMIGFTTAWLFGKRTECGKVCLYIGAGSAAVVSGIRMAVVALLPRQPDAVDALSMTMNVLYGLILLLPVTAYIEHCMGREGKKT